jgi:xanthine phosphoribosyltransferase
MQQLREAIVKQGFGIGKDTVKVDMFLNHRIDTGLLFMMGKALAERFAGEKPELILTLESSGIALAVAAAHELGEIPVVFAKKCEASNQSRDMVLSKVYSFTHKCENTIRADRKYLPMGSRALIVDDFLADGQAVNGMMDLLNQAGCPLCGVGIAVEKGFQSGGRLLREKGVNLMSLAVVKSIQDGIIVLEDD